MAYKVIILYRLYMPSYVLGTFTEYPLLSFLFTIKQHPNIMQYHDIQLFMLSYIRGFLFIFQQIWSQTLCTLQ